MITGCARISDVRKNLERGSVCHFISGGLLCVCRLLVKRACAYVVLATETSKTRALATGTSENSSFGNRNIENEKPKSLKKVALAYKTSKTRALATEACENNSFGNRTFENESFGNRNL